MIVWDDYARFLNDALTSVWAQQRDVALLVLDNASCVPIEVPDPRVRLHRSRRRHPLGAARNEALALVQTPLVLFLDADDTLLPNAVLVLEGLMAARPTLVAAGGGFRRLVPEDAPAALLALGAWPPSWTATLVSHRTMLCAIMTIRNVFPSVGAVLNTAVVRREGGFPSHLHEDWSLAAALCLAGPVELTTTPVLSYRTAPSSVSRPPRPRQERYEAHRNVIRRALRHPRCPPLLRASRPLLEWVAFRRSRRSGSMAR